MKMLFRYGVGLAVIAGLSAAFKMPTAYYWPMCVGFGAGVVTTWIVSLVSVSETAA